MIENFRYKIVFFILAFLCLVLVSPSKSLAYSGSCPDTMDPIDRLECLNEEYNSLNSQKANLESAIASEQQSQATFNQQIVYYDNKIQQTEISISELEVDIERNNVEIIILGNEIDEIQGNIDTITQEINLLEKSMKKSTKAGYKMTFVSPIELIFGSTDFDAVLRKMKYIARIKERDREMLTQMSVSRSNLEAEENALIEKRAEVQSLRNQTEEERNEMKSLVVSLASQKADLQNLLYASRLKEQSYSSSLEQVFAQRNAITEAIVQTILETGGGAEYVGYVSAGTLIGMMGSTGLSTGAHLHFCISDSGNSFYGTVDPFAYLTLGPDYYRIGTDPNYDLGFVYWYIYGNKITNPVGTIGSYKPYLTQDWHYGKCIDISSQAGYNAPIFAVMEGDLTRGIDQYGGRWAQIEHPNGWTTTYLHLQ